MDRSGFAPFVELPHGARARRCQAWRSRGDGQCGKPALRGHDRCPFHSGLGYPKRVREGRRQDPRLAGLRSGRRVRSETLAAVVAARTRFDAEFRARVRHYRTHPDDLHDLTPVLAGMRALCDLLSADVRPRVSRSGVAHPPALLPALAATGRMLEAASRMDARRRRWEAVPVALVRAFVDEVVVVLQKYVPASRLDAALSEFRFVSEERPKSASERQQ